MRCFYHRDTEAVGICKSCGRALCPDCVADIGKGIACSGRCEEDARAVIALVERNIRLSPQMARARSTAAVFNLFVGSVFIAWGITDAERFSLIIILGACVFAYGIFGLVQTRKIAKQGATRDRAA